MVAEQAVQRTRSSRPCRLNAQIALQNLRSRLDLMRRSLVNDMAVVDYVNPLRQRQRCRPDCRPVEAAEGAASIAACTNIAENMMGTVRRVTRNVKRWRDAGMALRWVAAGMIEANKGFRRLKAHKQLSVLRAALPAHHDRMTIKPVAHVTRAA